MKRYLNLYFSLLFIAIGCSERVTENYSRDSISSKLSQDSIIKDHLENDAWNLPIFSQERQHAIDKGLAKDSTIAYLWQQKAMPLFKQGKCEVGMPFLDKAVKYDPDRWQDYRAFIKCIFAKTYKASVADFLDCKSKYGNRVVMDHSYNFYIGLSYLQLNKFEEAAHYFQEDYDSLKSNFGNDWLHHLDLFYFGVSYYEMGNTEKAIALFDEALTLYPQFSDVQVYKALCLRKSGKMDEADSLFDIAEQNARSGYTINEDNVIYEHYPYQVRWP